VKEPAESKEIENSDVISLNLKFASKRLRFKPANVVQKDTSADDDSETHKSIEEDRKLFLQVIAFAVAVFAHLWHRRPSCA
jgi:hypothetical protein